MRNLILLIFLSLSSLSFGQDLTQINMDIGLTDSLLNDSEIRVYKGFGNENYTGIFRIFENNKLWKAEYFDHYAKTSLDSVITKKMELNSPIGIEKVWLKFLETRIADLPDMKEIDWKLKSAPQTQKVKGKTELVWKKIEIVDGESYVVFYRWGDMQRKITYWNPESYLKEYPTVDELIYFKEILALIRSEFKLWRNN